MILILILSFSTKAQKSGLEIYLIEQNFPDFTKDRKESDCYYCFEAKKEILFTDPLIKQSDIEYFDWDRQFIKLTNSGKEKIDSIKIPLQGLPVAMVLNGNPIYGFWFWNLRSSFGCDRVFTYPKLDFRIKFGLPATNTNGKDPRYNYLILEHILKSGLISENPNQRLISNSINDTTISEYFKDVFIKGHLINHLDDNIMLSITDSLFSTNMERQLFYFLTFTKSMNKSDGFYSEQVGLSATKFITERTERFADYFNIAPYLTDNDFQNWVDYIWGEIQISAENNEKEAVKKLTLELKENVKNNRKEYWVVIDRFIVELENKSP